MISKVDLQNGHGTLQRFRKFLDELGFFMRITQLCIKKHAIKLRVKEGSLVFEIPQFFEDYPILVEFYSDPNPIWADGEVCSKVGCRLR